HRDPAPAPAGLLGQAGGRGAELPAGAAGPGAGSPGGDDHGVPERADRLARGGGDLSHRGERRDLRAGARPRAGRPARGGGPPGCAPPGGHRPAPGGGCRGARAAVGGHPAPEPARGAARAGPRGAGRGAARAGGARGGGGPGRRAARGPTPGRAGGGGRAGRGGAGRRGLAPAHRGAGGRMTVPRSPGGTVVTVGSFDGVHLGHQAVIAEVARRAAAARRASILVTFEPHPLAVINPPAAPPLLSTGPERLEILAQLPLDYVLLLRFDRKLAALAPEEFVRDVLIARCGMQDLVVGYDHGFGRGRSGDVETLRRLGAE